MVFILAMVEVKVLERLEHFLARCSSERKKLLDGEREISLDGESLWHITDPRSFCNSHDSFGGNKSKDGSQENSFPCSIGTDDCDGFAPTERKTYVIDDVTVVERHGEMFNRKDG